jgi:hypothetical protein
MQKHMTQIQNSSKWMLKSSHTVVRICAAAALLTLAGCMPGGDDETVPGPKQNFAGGDDAQVNRSDKKASLLNISPVDHISRGFDETVKTVQRAGEQIAAVQPLGSSNDAVSSLPDAAPVSIEGSLSNFYSALKALEGRKRTKPVTIVHLGDAFVAGDQFTGDLRTQLQARFGRAGRGLMQPAIYPAQGIKFDRGGQWRAVSSVETEGFFGISGVKIVTSAPDAWLRLTATDVMFDWAEVTLETGPSLGTAIISAGPEQRTVTTASPKQELITVALPVTGRELKVTAKGDGEIRVHSWAAGNNKPGINYVNLGVAKASALTPARWNQAALEADMRRLAPSLIILSFGTSEGFDDRLNIPAYEQRVMQVVDRLKKAAPEASIIVTGPPDGARMPAFASAIGGGTDTCRPLTGQEIASYDKWMHKSDMRLARWFAPPKLQEARASLRRVAANSNAYFWDWSRLMGGACGIHAWVHSEPPLASADHVQLTTEGARRSARTFFTEMMAGYAGYAVTARK